MAAVKIEAHGNVAMLRLDNGPTNAISPDLLRDLAERVVEIRNNFNAVVLAGNKKFFSIGLDLPRLVKLNRLEMREFFLFFTRVTYDLFTLPVPTICAITGHAVAGGAVLALTSDYRFAAEGNKKIGLNEIKLGVPVPYLADLALREIVGERVATNMIYHGEFCSMAEAHQSGLIDQLYPPETVESEALNHASLLAGFPKTAFSILKGNRTEVIRHRYGRLAKDSCESFLDCWFEDATQKLLVEACKTF